MEFTVNQGELPVNLSGASKSAVYYTVMVRRILRKIKNIKRPDTKATQQSE